MALRAGYYGIKNKLLKQLINIPAQIVRKADAALLATVQTELTASKAYAVGEQFVYNQVLYKVIQAIAQGAQITIGTNAVVAGDVTEQISPSGTSEWIPIQQSGIFAYKYNSNVVFINISGAVTLDGDYIADFVLPENLRPTRTIHILVKRSGINGTSDMIAVELDGRLRYYSADSTTPAYLYGSGMYFRE